MKIPRVLPPTLLVVGAILLLPGVIFSLPPPSEDWWSVLDPSMELADTDLVIAYRAYALRSVILVTKLDSSLRPAFWNAHGSPVFNETVYPVAPQVRTDESGTIHLLWTLIDFTQDFGGPSCIRSLHYSRLAPTGESMVEDREMGFTQEVENCDAYYPDWLIEQGGNPVILGFDGMADSPGSSLFNLSCSRYCTPSIVLHPDGTWYAVTGIARYDTRYAGVEHVALYASRPGAAQAERVAVLASTDPVNPVSLPLDPPRLILIGSGIGLLVAGTVSIFLLRRRRK